MDLDYREYSFNWAGRKGWILADAYSAQAARYHFWHYIQERVLIDLNKERIEGWAPISSDLPSGVQLRAYKAFHYNSFQWLLVFFLTLSSFGLALLFLPFMRNWFWEPTGYRILLQRIE